MYYYDVATGVVQKNNPQGIFTYSSAQKLRQLQLVIAPFGNKRMPGFITQQTKKPNFNMKQLELTDGGELVLSEAFAELYQWFVNFYPVKRDEASYIFMPRFLTQKASNASLLPPTAPAASTLQLTAEQSVGLLAITNENRNPVLIHGDTGTGKTLVYFQAAELLLKKGTSTLLLAPEIPIATHLYKEAVRHFGSDSVILYHSALGDKERRKVWRQLLTNPERPMIVIGPRSALFLPVVRYGLVCVDEAHEQTYKQTESPHYNTLEVAATLARIHHAQLVLGSATPPLREYYYFTKKNYPIVRMKQVAAEVTQDTNKHYELIDQRDRQGFTRNPYLSDVLIARITEALNEGRQSLVLHNKRGTARAVTCTSCGWSLGCQRCDTPMTFHHDEHRVRCHICGYSADLPSSCPKCHNPDITLKGIGSKALELQLQALFPSARIARFDSDNLKSETLSYRMEEVLRGDIDILVGTQLLAKGLDLKNLQVVGITSADSILQIPDFASHERLLQLTLQAIGRVGRGHGKSICVIQTYQPDNQIFRYIIDNDWEGFYNSELKDRQLHRYPPFVYLAKITVQRKTENGAKKATEKIIDKITTKGVAIIGPSQSFYVKRNNLFEWQLLLKSASRQKILEIGNNLPPTCNFEIDPISLL